MTFIEPDHEEPFAGLEPAAPFEAPVPPLPSDPPPPVVEDSPPGPDPDVFSREYVEGLRREAAGYRTQLRGYEERFEGYTDDEREAILQYTHLSRRAELGDALAAQQLQELFGGDDEPDPEPADPRELARQAALEVYEEQRQAADAERQRTESVDRIRASAEGFGYPGDSEDYILFVRAASHAASNGSENPLEDADKAVKAYRQSIIDAHVKAIQDQNAASPTVPTASGGVPGNTVQPRTLAEAREAASERFRNAGMR